MTSRTSILVEQVTTSARNNRFLFAILLLATFIALTPKQAHAQYPRYPSTSSDTWKSVAIIGGSTAAGAYIGHKVAGRNGAYIGAAAGAATGYAIDRRRRQNEYNNGYYGNNGGYYGPYSNAPYGYPYGYQGQNYYSSGPNGSRR